MNITLGADPEVFVFNTAENRLVSGHDLLIGTKKKPQPIFKGAVQVDGVALEYNINPAKNQQEFAAYNTIVLRQLNEMIRAKQKTLRLAIQPVAHFQQKYFDENIPENAKILGCEPDFNAYTGDKNPKPKTTKPMRTAAGHLHIGWTEKADINAQEHFMDCMAVTKQLDHSIGFLSHLWDQDKERQELYGKMGSFRPKPYGVEYRPLSNAWLKYPKLWPWLYQTANRAVNDLLDGKKYWINANLPFKDVGFPDSFPNLTANKKAYNEIRKNFNILLDMGYKHLYTQETIKLG